MKKIALIIALICLTFTSFAFDFSSISPSGHTLYYNIFGGNYVCVIYKDSAYTPGTISGDLVIPSTVTYQGHTYPVRKIGEGAFHKCSGLTSVILGDSISEIDYAFDECVNLSWITLPNSLTSIAAGAFYGCISLQNVYFSGDVSQWLRISFGGSLTSNPVYYSKRLYFNEVLVTTLAIPQGTITIPKNSFCGLSTIEEIILPNSVLSIDDYAFNSCSGVNKVVMPSVHRIGHKAFENCSSIDTIISENSTPPICLSDSPSHNIATFNGVPMDAIIIIPCHSNDDYCNAEGWNYFVFFESIPIAPQIEINSANPSMGSVHYYFLNDCMDSVVAVATPFSGYHFDHWSNGETSNPYYFFIDETPISLTGVFEEGNINYCQVSLSVNNEFGGEVYGSGNYIEGDSICCYALPNDGYAFLGWSNGEQENPLCFRVYSNINLVAMFMDTIHPCFVNLSVNDITMGGTTGSGQYHMGDTAVCAAIPFEGFSFRGWSNGSQENPYTFVVTSNVELMAVFVSNIGLEEYVDNILFCVYPNPAKTSISIIASFEHYPMPIIIQDISGCIVKEEIINGSYTVLDISGLTNGIYLLRVGKHIQKLIIK